MSTVSKDATIGVKFFAMIMPLIIVVTRAIFTEKDETHMATP